MADDNDIELMPVQASLIDVEDVDAVLFERPMMEKRYTAGQVKELMRLREAVFMLLPAWPVEDIARRLGMSTRTVRALAVQFSEKVAGCTSDFKQVLRSTSMRWLTLARTREHDATFKELAFAAKLTLDALKDLELTGGVEGEKVINEERDRAAAALELRALMEVGTAARPAPRLATGTTDSASSAAVGDCRGLGSTQSACASIDVGGDVTEVGAVEREAGQAGRVGGDAPAQSKPDGSMGSTDRDLPATPDRSPESDLPAKGDA